MSNGTGDVFCRTNEILETMAKPKIGIRASKSKVQRDLADRHLGQSNGALSDQRFVSRRFRPERRQSQIHAAAYPRTHQRKQNAEMPWGRRFLNRLSRRRSHGDPRRTPRQVGRLLFRAAVRSPAVGNVSRNGNACPSASCLLGFPVVMLVRANQPVLPIPGARRCSRGGS